MDYTHLTAEQADELRHRRVLDLEIEHYRVKLTLEETPENEPAHMDLAELERRIALHRAELGIVLPPPDGVAPEMPDTPGSGDEAQPTAADADPGAMNTAHETPVHEQDERPEGLETKAVDPAFASTATHEFGGGETGIEQDASTDGTDGGAQDDAAEPEAEHRDGGEPTSSV